MPAIDFKKEHKRDYLFRDTRTGSEKIAAWLTSTTVVASLAGTAMVVCLLFGAISDLVALFTLTLCGLGLLFLRREGLPMYMPKSSGEIDPRELHPETGKALPAQGIIYAGTDMSTKREVWLSDTQARTHALFLGTTGSGKAQPVDTPVLTPGGWRLLGNLKPGDWVSTPAGGQARVLSVHPQGFRPIYELKVEDGPGIALRTQACPDHLWAVRTQAPGEAQAQEQTLTSEQIIGLLSQKVQCWLPVVDIREARLNAQNNAVAFMPNGLDTYLLEEGPPVPTELGASKPRWGRILRVRKRRAQNSLCIKLDSPDSLYVVRGSQTFYKDANGILAQKGIVTHNTEFLLSIVYNGLIHVSGFIYVDGKGDAKTYRSIYSLLRATGRDDDALIINFQTGAKDIIGAQASKMSNTLNICATGSSGMLAQSFMGLMATGKQDVWSERANSLIEALTKPLVFLRDHYKRPLDVSVVREYFVLEWIEAMVLYFQYSFPGIEHTLSGLKAYLDNLPGWTRDKAAVKTWVLQNKWNIAADEYTREVQAKGGTIPKVFDKEGKETLAPQALARIQEIANSKFDFFEFKQAYDRGLTDAQGKAIPGQDQDTLLQHGYITMQLVRSFNSLSDTYGYIMKTAQAEVDMADVFLNRRILMVLLPALEKAPAELSNLGKIIVATLKTTMAIGLGGQVEGETIRIIDSRPTNSFSPFMCVLDEYGYYAVEGFAVVPAQARSLGFSAIFAGQDLPAFEKSSKEEAKSTLANANSKFCGKLECTETYEYFHKLSGEGTFSAVRQFDNDGTTLLTGSKFFDSKSISLEKYARVSQDDLRGHGSGKWHFFFGNIIIHLNSFFANPRPVSLLRTNHFIKVVRPEEQERRTYRKATELFCQAIGRALPDSEMERALSRGEMPPVGLHALLENEKYLSFTQEQAMAQLLETYQGITLKPLQERGLDLSRLAGVRRQYLRASLKPLSAQTLEESAEVLKHNAKEWQEELSSMTFPNAFAHQQIMRGNGLAHALAAIGRMAQSQPRHDPRPNPGADSSYPPIPEEETAPHVLHPTAPELPEDLPEFLPALYLCLHRLQSLLKAGNALQVPQELSGAWEREIALALQEVDTLVCKLTSDQWEQAQQYWLEDVLGWLRSPSRLGRSWMRQPHPSLEYALEKLVPSHPVQQEQRKVVAQAQAMQSSPEKLRELSGQARALAQKTRGIASMQSSPFAVLAQVLEQAPEQLGSAEGSGNLALLNQMHKQQVLAEPDAMLEHLPILKQVTPAQAGQQASSLVQSLKSLARLWDDELTQLGDGNEQADSVD